MMRHIAFFAIFCISMLLSTQQVTVAHERPNILIAISDDQSFPHASAYGSTMVNTPHFDHVAREGILWTSAFCASPGPCSPPREPRS